MALLAIQTRTRIYTYINLNIYIFTTAKVTDLLFLVRFSRRIFYPLST